MQDLSRRISHYGSISTELSLLSYQQLIDLLSKFQMSEVRVDGTSGVLKVGDINVFEKGGSHRSRINSVE